MCLLVIADIEDMRWKHGAGEADILLSFVDILRSDFPGGEKAVWLVLVWLMPFVGAVRHMTIGRRRKG